MSLTQKIWLLVTIPFVIAILSYLAATRPFRRELLIKEAAREGRDDVAVLTAALAHGVIDETDDRADFNALTESISLAERVIGVAVYGRDGTVLARSKRLEGNADVDALAQRALQANVDVSELRESLDGAVLQHAVRLGRAGPATGGVAIVLREIGYVDEMIRAWNFKLLLIGIGFATVMLIVSRPIVRAVIGNPLGEVVLGVEKVAAGDLDVRVPDVRRDELGRLARAFNAMTDSLRISRARAEEEHASRAALEAHLRQIQTLAAAGEVAASLAHEIGSPLNVILGRTRMVAARPDTSETARRDLEIVAVQTERITRVVQKLLSISRPSKAKIEEVDVRSVIEETLGFIAPECRKRKIVAAFTVASDAPVRVLGDRDQLMQILFNLCHNALQAQPNGGRIDVRVRRSAEPIAGSSAVEIEVSDAGPGVEPEIRGRVFDPFITTKRGEGGTGLGLAIVDGMARELGGRVEVDDSPTGGACFRVKIPAMTREIGVTGMIVRDHVSSASPLGGSPKIGGGIA